MTLPDGPLGPINKDMNDDATIDRQFEYGTAANEIEAENAPPVDLLTMTADACRTLAEAGSEGNVFDIVRGFVSTMDVSPQAPMECGCETGVLDLVDCLGVNRGGVEMPLGRMSTEQENAVRIVATQAGMVLGCHALQSCSVKDVSSRQIAEFEASRLRKMFDRRLEEALAERSIWAEVFKSSQYGVCIVSPGLRYLSFNPAFQEWFVIHGELPPQVGQHVSEVLGDRPDVLPEARACWTRALRGEEFIHAWKIVSRGREYHYETRYTPLLDEDGELKAAVQFSLDVTDRVAERGRLEVAETALRQSQKMEAVGKLTGGIAHDFNNILTGIVGAIDIIGRKMADGKLDGVPKYLDMAATSANRAASLTHRLLAFSRRQPVDPRLTDVDALVLGMEEMIARALGPDICVDTSTSGTSARVLCDPSQLESAIMNLVVNSREAMPEGGRVLIATTIADMDQIPAGEDVRPGAFVHVAVSDNGTGMTPDVMVRAVEPFYTTKGIGHGTGLGLSMVYGFARQSGGFLDMRSAENEGTTISLYLPATTVTHVVEQEPATSLCSCRDATVLVVEDEPAVRAIVVELLEEMGCQVLQAEDGGAGAAILSSDARIDVLVTDIGLPVMNGRQVATAARAGRPNIPILFMTGYSENATITEGFGGRTTLVTKPFRPAQIAEALGRMLE